MAEEEMRCKVRLPDHLPQHGEHPTPYKPEGEIWGAAGQAQAPDWYVVAHCVSPRAHFAPSPAEYWWELCSMGLEGAQKPCSTQCPLGM